MNSTRMPTICSFGRHQLHAALVRVYWSIQCMQDMDHVYQGLPTVVKALPTRS
jgi:hypothetical protein